MTTWVDSPHGGRERGPRGLARAWVEVMMRPRRFFHNGVSPGDQAPGLTFAVAVALANLFGRLAFAPSSLPDVGAGPVLSTLLLVLLTGLVVAPAVLHLTAALQTVLLVALVPDRGGISGTVQVLAYSSAPCALAGATVPLLRTACCLWGAGLLVLGLQVVHGTSLTRAATAGAIPAALLFGYGFGGFAAGQATLAALTALFALATFSAAGPLGPVTW